MANSIIDAVDSQSDLNPGSPAIILPKSGLIYSFQNLAQLTHSVAHHLQAQGIKAGMRVLLMVPPGIDLLAAAFGLIRLGAIPVIIDPGMGKNHFLHCLKQTQPHAFLGIPKARLLLSLASKDFKHIPLKISVHENHFLNKIGEIPYPPFPKTPPADATCAITFTSGSTGSPKGVVYTHAIFESQIRLLKANLNIHAGETDIPLLPIFALFNPALGMTTLVPEINPSKPAAFNPKSTVQAIQQYQATNSFGSPILWSKIATYCEERDLTLPSLKRILMAGCSVPRSLLLRLKKIAPFATIYSPYGATECLPLTLPSEKEILSQPDSPQLGTYLGKPLAEIEIRIENPDPSGIGEILVTGPVVTQEYFANPDATQKAKVLLENKCWHRMGDMGYFDNHGGLWFCGRKVERIPFNNQFLYTDPLENLMNTCPLVYRSALIQANSVPAFVIQPKDYPWTPWGRTTLLKQIRGFASSFPELNPVKHFFLIKKMPVDVRHNAKIHRLTLAKQFSS